MAYVTPGTVAAGDVATAAAWNVVVNDVIALKTTITRLAHVTATATHGSSATTVAGASNIFATNASFTADGTSSYLIAFQPGLAISTNTNGASARVYITDGSSTTIASPLYMLFTTAGAYTQAGLCQFYYTPAAGTITLNARMIVAPASTAGIYAGTGTAGGDIPIFLSVFGPAIA
jgi:hypothetical protein